jgi:predicted kinase
MTCGLNHTGKTTFWKALQSQLSPSIIVDNDQLRIFAQNNFPDLYGKTKQFKDREWNQINMKTLLFKTMIEYSLANQVSCIHTACNTYREQRKRILQIAKQNWATTIVVFFDIPLETIRQRIANEISHKDQSLYKHWFEGNLEWMLDVFETPSPDEADYFFHITDNEQWNDVLEKILLI